MKEKTDLVEETLLVERTDLMKTFDLLEKPEVEADRLFKLMDGSIQGLRQYRLIVTALELGVFEALKTPLRAGDLAKRLECSPVLMPHFCEALCSLGLLERFEEGVWANGNGNAKRNGIGTGTGNGKDGENSHDSGNGQNADEPVYLISELSASFLLKESPFSQQNYLAEKLRNIELWARLPELLRKGPEVVEKGPFFGGVIHCMAENARCGLLQETVRTVMENIDLGNVRKLLDLGGGHGLYAIAIAKQNEGMKAFVFDLPPVTEKTKQFIEKFSASNVDVIPGDFFKDELGNGYDLIFSSFNPGGKVPSLIPKIAAALNPGAIFITRQVPDEKMQSNPLFNLDWNLWTFEDTKKGSSGYSFENSVPFNEYIGMLGNYGLEVFKTLDMEDGSRMVFAKKQE